MDVGNRYNYLRPHTIFLLPRFQISAPVLANKTTAKIHHPKYIHVFVVGGTHIKSVLHQNEFISRFAWRRSLQEILYIAAFRYKYVVAGEWILALYRFRAPTIGLTAQCRYIKSK